MTEFTETAMRHYCRNPKCRMRLPAPISNEREAFCTRGCYSAFYRKRCRVCEQPIEQPKRGERLICRRAACINAFREDSDAYRYHGRQSAESTQEVPDFIDLKPPLKPDRGIEWAVAVNSARVRASRRVLDAVFGGVQTFVCSLSR
jgi:hypothetical protein